MTEAFEGSRFGGERRAKVLVEVLVGLEIQAGSSKLKYDLPMASVGRPPLKGGTGRGAGECDKDRRPLHSKQ